MKYKAVLFDLDDTLTDSYRARLLALQRVFRDAGIANPSAEEVLQSYDGSPFEPILNTIATEHEVPSDLFTEYRKALFSTPPGLIPLYPGVKPLLERLHARGAKLGVVTAKLRLAQIAGGKAGASQDLHEAGVAELFDVVVGYEDTTNHKPHPEPVQLALASLSVAPEESIFVGDTPADIEAGRAAGCRTCLATWGATRHPPGTVDADLVAETPEKLLTLLLGNAS